MRNLTIIHVGAMKEAYYTEAVKEYEKRVSNEFSIKDICIKESMVEDEGGKVLAKLTDKSYKIALCVEGISMSSERFAQTLYKDAEGKPLEIIIGGHEGLSEKVKSVCNARISFSAMTFPHRLMRVILAEQIYRAYTIDKGLKYHK
ncbi:ribosomal RNA large subunit methyltransferase H [Clostridia bacterium]|nr:ribosomal RNA large subunit methyltransferase H [Clostridia bacterium]GHV11848.1 ribosomal RNA large subunit methyltransferase H [Clostridia bacterium]